METQYAGLQLKAIRGLAAVAYYRLALLRDWARRLG
jgi:hypothetical protein